MRWGSERFKKKTNPDPAFHHVNDGWISHVSCALLQKFVTNFVLLYLTYEANVNPLCHENYEKCVTKNHHAWVPSQKILKILALGPLQTNKSVWFPEEEKSFWCFRLWPETSGQKTSLLNFKHKIATSANYTDNFGTGYTSHSKRLKNYFKINQSN